MTARLKGGLLAGLLVLPTIATAHTGAEGSGFLQGFAHPLAGIDHLLAMVAIGMMASRCDGNHRWLIPVCFIATMVLGGAAGALGLALPKVEMVIALSVIAFGTAIYVRRFLPMTIVVPLVAGFALFHGHAHGSEMSAAVSLVSFTLGFVAATALLHALGLLLSNRIRTWGQDSLSSLRVGGGAIAIAGLTLLGATFA